MSFLNNSFPKLSCLTRREWVTRNAAALVATQLSWRTVSLQQPRLSSSDKGEAREIREFHDWELLAQRAVDAAMRAGAQYADVRLTRTLEHAYTFVAFSGCRERIGVGVRALVNGYWGFAATPGGDVPEVERLARAAVAQAKVNAQGTPRTVDLGNIPPAAGHWTMPVGIDPFTVPIEEKFATMEYWIDCASLVKLELDKLQSTLFFVRQERVMANSEGARFTQTTYESAGKIVIGLPGGNFGYPLTGLQAAGKGWEMFADVPEKIRKRPPELFERIERNKNPKTPQVGRYTLVCDGATMASLVDRTIGIATQLDRALGYEANASGTSCLNEPLEMLGTFKAGSPLVTVTANRTAPGQLATVKWDEEGVVPQPFTLIKEGVLVDYQTTREQAAWLKPYYDKQGTPVRSNGCAALEDATAVPMQHPPNLALMAGTQDIGIAALAAQAKEGILITEGQATADFQARTGEITSRYIYEIRNGKIGRRLLGSMAVQFDALDLWRHVTALGGPATQEVLGITRFPYLSSIWAAIGFYPMKGEPPQWASYSVSAPAAMIANQALIDMARKA